MLYLLLWNFCFVLHGVVMISVVVEFLFCFAVEFVPFWIKLMAHVAWRFQKHLSSLDGVFVDFGRCFRKHQGIAGARGR